MYDGRFGSAERTRSAALEGSAKRPFEALFADSKGVHSGLDGLNKPAIESHHTFYRTTYFSIFAKKPGDHADIQIPEGSR